MNVSFVLSIAACIFTLMNGIGRITEGRKIWMTQAYSYKMKLRPVTITRLGKNTHPRGLSMLLSGMICISVTGLLLLNNIYDPLALVVYPLVAGGLVEIVGLEISENRFRSESN